MLLTEWVFGIPENTLRRRLKARGPSSILRTHNEAALCNFLILQKHGFAPTISFVCSMAFELAEKLNLPYKFNKEFRKAVYSSLLFSEEKQKTYNTKISGSFTLY